MNLKKPISAAMAAIMSLSVTATPVLAADGDPPNTDTLANDTESVVTLGEQSAAEEERLAAAGQSEQNYQSTTVYSVANGSYVLTVPESINLHNIEKNDLASGLYTNDKHRKVNLRGNVRQDQSVMVTFTDPDLLVTK